MDLSTYVDALRRELAVAASAGGDEARALTERLTAPLESATRLALLEALSDAADEITRDLAPGSVEVRLRGRDPEFVVTSPPVDLPFDDGPENMPRPVPPVVADVPPLPADGDEGGTSRITLRLPEHLKPHIDEAAGRAGLSVNAWLVRVVAGALEPGAAGHDPRRGADPDRRASTQLGQRFTGWAR